MNNNTAKKLVLSVAPLVGLCLLQSVASAQWYGGGWGMPGQGATVASSNMYGMSSIIRSAGEANLMNSAAAQNWQSAYSQDLNNRIQGTNTYFEQRRINREAVAEERGPRVTAAELTHFAKEAAPRRLTTSQLDPVTGEVQWPLILQDPQYAKPRDQVDHLFAQREMSSGAVGSGGYRAIRDAIDQLRSEFAKNIRNYNPQNYVDARRFLDSLEYEARFLTSG